MENQTDNINEKKDMGNENNTFYDYVAINMMDQAKTKTFYGTHIVNRPFLNNLYFNVRNNTYEVNVMWCLLIVTIILLLSLLLKDANDEVETQRVL